MKPAIPFLADTALATVDTLPPKLTSLSLPKTLYTAAGDAALWLSASASDESAGILSLTLRFSSSFALDDGQAYLESVLILDHWNGGYAAALLDLDRATPAKSYAIEEAILEDRYGNTATYTQADLVSAGFATGFAVAASGTNKPPAGQPTASLPAGQEDVAYALKSSDLLKGFADPEGGALTLFSPSASHGQLAYNPAAKTWIFQPEAEYSGPVQVDYAVADDRGGVVSASRSFTLAAVNDPPAGTPSAKLPDGVQTKQPPAKAGGFK